MISLEPRDLFSAVNLTDSPAYMKEGRDEKSDRV